MDLRAPREMELATATSAPATSTSGSAIPSRQVRPRASLLRQLLGCILVASISFGCFHVMSRYVLQSVQVIGLSMSPTLHDSERYLLNRLVYHLREPRPQDIIVLRDPEDQTFAVKRIIATEGDTVHVKDGKLFINGEEIQEPYLPAGTPTYTAPRCKEQFWICGHDQYFVLGDNRNNSTDSRMYGTVNRQDILGLLML